MGKTVFSDTPPQGTIVTAAFLNALNNHRHTGRDIDGEGALDYAISTGSANAYILTLPQALSAHVRGMPVIFQANHTNTGAATININGLGAVSLKKNLEDNLEADDIIAGKIYVVHYDGTNLQVLNPSTLSDVPVGAFIDFAGPDVPDGFLLCPTAQTNISRAVYAKLYAKIGTTWGSGDGSTTFGLPWFPIDYAAVQANANVGSRSVGSVIAHSHLGGVQESANTVNGAQGAFAVGDDAFPTGTTGGAANYAAGVRVLKCVRYK